MSRIVIKVGSNILTRKDGMPNFTNMSSLVDQIARLIKKSHEVVLVSSGAVACGRGAIVPKKELDSVEARQLFSSIGQIRLINLYNQLFGAYGITIGQILTQKENFSSRTAYLNQRACMITMLENGVLPVINENDTVSLTELMFTDNDELSGLIATMIDADFLIILSNVDGIFTGNPTDPESKLISEIKPGKDVSEFIQATKSGFGRGGMGTKYKIASKVASEGIGVKIARGDRPDVLVDLIENPGEVPHTSFVPSKEGLSTVKRWIAHSSSFAKGRIYINQRAKEALLSESAVSLLPIGITRIEGDWAEGDIVRIYGPSDQYIGVGKASADSITAKEFLGQHGKKPVVHYDYLYIESDDRL